MDSKLLKLVVPNEAGGEELLVEDGVGGEAEDKVGAPLCERLPMRLHLTHSLCSPFPAMKECMECSGWHGEPCLIKRRVRLRGQGTPQRPTFALSLPPNETMFAFAFVVTFENAICSNINTDRVTPNVQFLKQMNLPKCI